MTTGGMHALATVIILVAAICATAFSAWSDRSHSREVIRIACNSEHGGSEACLAAVERKRSP